MNNNKKYIIFLTICVIFIILLLGIYQIQYEHEITKKNTSIPYDVNDPLEMTGVDIYGKFSKDKILSSFNVTDDPIP